MNIQMEQNKVTENVAANPQENANGQKSFLDLGAIYTAVILNWKWFVLSNIICLRVSAI